jgi:hypothetical protein
MIDIRIREACSSIDSYGIDSQNRRLSDFKAADLFPEEKKENSRI